MDGTVEIQCGRITVFVSGLLNVCVQNAVKPHKVRQNENTYQLNNLLKLA